MKLAGISEAELARTTNLPQATINKILHKLTKDPRLSTIVVIADALNVTIAQLAGLEPLSGNDQAPQISPKNFIPVVEWSEVLSYVSDADYSCEFKKWLAVDAEQNMKKYFALKTTPSMAPRFRENSLIIVAPAQSCEEDGRIVLISFNNNEPTLRRVMKDGADLLFRKLHPEAGDKASKLKNADRILGVVVETRMPE
jgi:SOS-response transcriptional repressor LexA